MIKKIVTTRGLREPVSQNGDLAYWLSRTPQERVAAVDYLRRPYFCAGNTLEAQPDFKEVLGLFNAHRVECRA